MGKKNFAIKVMFVFDCEFYIQADNEEEAKEKIRTQCNFAPGGKITTTLPMGMCDWKFNPYPKTIIIDNEKITES